jgi:predicted RNase H-like nuclease (RuvC/YqgF family)
MQQLGRDEPVPNEPPAGIKPTPNPVAGYDTDDLLAENRRLRSGLTQMREEVLRLGRALETMHQFQAEVFQLRSEVDRLRAASHTDQEMANQLKELLQATAMKEREFSGQIKAIHASSSWRITRPLRWIARSMRK